MKFTITLAYTTGVGVLLLAALLLAACAPNGAPTPPPRPPIHVTPTTPPDEVAALNTTERLPYDRIDLARAFPGAQVGAQENASTPAVPPQQKQVGDMETFWVNHLARNTNYSITAELRYVGPVVLAYVEQGLALDQAVLEQRIHTFEQDVYPRTRSVFGSEWQPGVDNDPRITILHTQQQGDNAAGYYSPRDSTPRSANRFSNEREMFYMKIPPSNAAYLMTLSHEFQHMIHWNEQRRSAAWLNEGCATLSQDINGFVDNSFINTYLGQPGIQLTTWSQDNAISHYGAAHLFVRYIATHYASEEEGLAPLLRANASNNLERFAEFAAPTRPDITSFDMLFGDWAVANLLNDPAVGDGRYAYPPDNTLLHGVKLLPHTITPRAVEMGEQASSAPQFSATYLRLPDNTRLLTFTGAVSVSLVGAQPRDRFAWWSGRGDNSIATLTRRFDLGDFEQAVLHFDTWYEIENDYDYAFVSVSTDGGKRWHLLQGTHTTSADPQGANYGHGLTGVSGVPGANAADNTRGEWVSETMDLSPYAGHGDVLLRFWQINDEAINTPGWLLDNLRICRSESTENIADCPFADDVEAGANGWQAAGFARVDGDLPQRWELRLVRASANGTREVERLATDEAGRAVAQLAAGESGVLVIAPTTPHTTEPASYRLVIR